jgi:polysaccharide pyruvyl transferase WcaK-like protein
MSRMPAAHLTVFDFGKGVRKGSIDIEGRTVTFDRCGMHNSRRYYARDCLWNIRVSSWLGGLNNPAAIALRGAEAVLDISGGDSFCDLYGRKRFEGVTVPKEICLRLETPLVLLPQTYGPFADCKRRLRAAVIVRGATMAWARDARSFAVLKELAGDQFDPVRHKQGVDVAFLLPREKPQQEALKHLCERLLSRQRLVLGLNVSGLIYNDPVAAKTKYGFKADYREVLVRFGLRLLKKTDADVLLLPHVLRPHGDPESDPMACETLRQQLGSPGRVFIPALPYNEREAKWLISHLDWFCATRMHAAIAALSTSVPAAAIAYSMKTAGVFETCDQGNEVIDPRVMATDEVVERLWDSYLRRQSIQRSLSAAGQRVLQAAEDQMNLIASTRFH